MKKNIKRIKTIMKSNLLVILGVIVIAIVLFIGGHGKTVVVKDMAKSLTTEMVEYATSLKDAKGSEKKTLEKKLNETIKKRERYMLNLMKNDPKDFFLYTVTNKEYNEFFKDVPGVEKLVTLEGELQILCASKEDGSHSDIIEMVTDEKEYYQISFTDNTIIDELNTRDKVKATGYVLASQIVTNNTAPMNFGIMGAAQLLPTADNHKVAIIMISFPHYPIAPWTNQAAMTQMTAYQDWMEEVSLGNATFSGKNDPVVDIYNNLYFVDPGVGCNYNSWMNQAMTLAGDDGFVESGYRFVMLVFPSTSANHCNWSGLGLLGGTYTWFNQQYGGNLIHELGHNLGLSHARAANCTLGVNRVSYDPGGTGCYYNEYGDVFDVMGDPSTEKHYSAVSKSFLGWIPPTNVTTVTTSGYYDIYPLENATTNPQLVKIPINYRDAQGRTQSYTYYLDFRTVTTWDAYTPNSNPVRGVAIRTARQGWFSDLYDATPATSTFADAALPIGQGFHDPIRDITIRTVSADDTKAVVDITLPQPIVNNCVTNPATYSISTSAGATVNPGTTVKYTISITNNNSLDCAPTTFYGSVDKLELGFTADKENDSIVIASGATGKLKFDVKSHKGIGDGLYLIKFTASNPSGGYQTFNGNYFVTDKSKLCD